MAEGLRDALLSIDYSHGPIVWHYLRNPNDKRDMRSLCHSRASCKFWGHIHISGIAVKFCTKGDYIKSCQRDNKSNSSRDQFLPAQLWT